MTETVSKYFQSYLMGQEWGSQAQLVLPSKGEENQDREIDQDSLLVNQ